MDFEKEYYGHTQSLRNLKRHPLGKDERIRAYASARLDMDRDPGLRSRLIEQYAYIFEHRRRHNKRYTHGYNVGLELRACHFRMINTADWNQPYKKPASLDLPRDLDAKKNWAQILPDLMQLERRPEMHDIYPFTIMTEEIQTNIAERYKALKLILLAYRDRFSAPRVLDVGCSINLGPKKLVIGQQESPFRLTDVVTDPERPLLRREKDIYSRALNQLLAQNITIQQCTGIDIKNMNDSQNQLWPEACLYTSELLPENPRHQEFLKIREIQPDNVTFICDDFASPTSKLRRMPPANQFDVVNFSTIFYLLDDEARETMIERAKAYVADDGLIVIQDFISETDGGPTYLDAIDAAPYSYKTMVLDMTRPDDGFTEFCSWDSGRCNKLGLTAGNIVLSNLLTTV